MVLEIKLLGDECCIARVFGRGAECRIEETANKRGRPCSISHQKTMARIWWYTSFLIFVWSAWLARSSDTEDVTLDETTRHSFFLSKEDPLLPGGANFNHELGEEADEEKEINPVVRLQQGYVLGSVTLSRWTGRPIYQFRGIPYAKSPVGDLRFRVIMNSI